MIRTGKVPLRRLCGAVALLAAPMIMVLLGLVLFGHLAWMWGLVAALVLVAWLSGIVARHLQGLATV
ncbi:MAG TPA: hypothetical protein VHM01_08700, partial [Alphaproteobacteria bacterium]|nr:hypothetical protein [Alphaproteobacteria bacterium]